MTVAVCRAVHDVEEEGVLICDLEDGDHELHYDETDDVSWKEGRP